MIEFIKLTKGYEDQEVLNDITFNVQAGEFVTILGESGCGKTTLLKTINRLIDFDSGDIKIDGQSILEIEPVKLRRGIGYVIQNIGLLPHLSIEENLIYVLSLNGEPLALRKQRAKELLKLIQLDSSYLQKRPRQLSGGERQRVGVARAIAANPNIVLMDEPFSAVDEITRKQLQDDLIALQKELQMTIFFVTHDINEALKLGSKVIVLNNGRIEQIGSPREIVLSPKTKYVQDFIGVKGLEAIVEEKTLENFYEKVIKDEINKH